MRFIKKKTPITTPQRRSVRLGEPAGDDLSSPFKRGRTLTGTSSQRIRSVNEAGAQMQSPRTHVHHLANQRKRVLVLLAVVAVASLLLYVVVSQFTAQVRVVLVDFPNKNVQQTYETVIQSYFDRHPIERLRMFTDTVALAEYAQGVNPEIMTVDIEPSAEFATSTVGLTVRRPVASWTADTKEYVDGDGIAFHRNYYTSPKLQIIDKSNVPIPAGQAIVSDAFLGFVGRLVGALHNQGYTVTRVVIPEDATHQVSISLKGVSFYIKCLVDRPAGEQAEDISRVIRYLREHRTTPQYVDVRIAGKAYYR